MNIVHIAWLGHKNYGDDLMAQAVQAFPCIRKADRYIVWSDAKPAGGHARWIYPFNVKFNVVKRFFENRALKKADLLIIGGGSILHSPYSIQWKKRGVDYLKGKKPSAKAIGVGLSVGLFPNQIACKGCQELLESLDGASFRDLSSYKFALECKLPYTPLLSFDLAACYVKQNGYSPKSIPDKISVVGIAPRIFSRQDASFDEYYTLTKALCEKHDQVKLFSFSDESSGDQKYIYEIGNLLRANNLQVLSYGGDVDEFTQHIRSCDFLISTRLHGAIMAFLLNIPFSCICYHKKCDDLAAYIQLPEKYVFKQPGFSASVVIDSVSSYTLPCQEKYINEAMKNYAVFKNLDCE